jgi:hypothetical protein
MWGNMFNAETSECPSTQSTTNTNRKSIMSQHGVYKLACSQLFYQSQSTYMKHQNMHIRQALILQRLQQAVKSELPAC